MNNYQKTFRPNNEHQYNPLLYVYAYSISFAKFELGISFFVGTLALLQFIVLHFDIWIYIQFQLTKSCCADIVHTNYMINANPGEYEKIVIDLALMQYLWEGDFQDCTLYSHKLWL